MEVDQLPDVLERRQVGGVHAHSAGRRRRARHSIDDGQRPSTTCRAATSAGRTTCRADCVGRPAALARRSRRARRRRRRRSPPTAGSSIVSTQPTQAEVERAGRGRGAAAANRQSLAIVSLADGKVTTIAGVRSFRLARDNGTWLAYVAEPDCAPVATRRRAAARRAALAAAVVVAAVAAVARQAAVVSSARTLVLRNLATGAEERLDRRARRSRSTTAPRCSATPSCRAIRRRTARSSATWRRARRRRCSRGRGDYKALTFDRDRHAARLRLGPRRVRPRRQPRYTLYQASAKGGARAGDRDAVAGARRACTSPTTAAIAFTRTGTAITFNVAPPPIDSVPADSLVGKAVFDLWHYKDPGAPADAAAQRRARPQQVATRRSTTRRRRSSCSSPTTRSRT